MPIIEENVTQDSTLFSVRLFVVVAVSMRIPLQEGIRPRHIRLAPMLHKFRPRSCLEQHVPNPESSHRLHPPAVRLREYNVVMHYGVSASFCRKKIHDDNNRKDSCGVHPGWWKVQIGGQSDSKRIAKRRIKTSACGATSERLKISGP